ncbi:hypothetical protein [Microcoleus sp. FACHB-672]|nr:hypothetical protein [Microcoleus sp. FACHB-672]MBD2042128.1 hypothetical protein [Microcoleus sp. FACHB-672]
MNLEIAAFAASINNLPKELTGNPSNYASASAFLTALNQRAGELQVSR